MSGEIKKVNEKLDVIADQAKQGAHELAEKIIDSAKDVVHTVAESAREHTANAGEKIIDVGEKITKFAK